MKEMKTFLFLFRSDSSFIYKKRLDFYSFVNELRTLSCPPIKDKTKKKKITWMFIIDLILMAM